MSQVQANLLYTKEHEWVEKLSDTLVRVGITDFAQDQLGDIVFVELPKVGTTITAEDSIGSVESVKTVSDIFSPVTGKVTNVNSTLEQSPELVNSNPFDQGWMVEVEISGAGALDGLLTAAEYEAYIG
ncbi:glycine cleavage system protein GcvH [Paenibacillus hexagrammi]|uniref:Glycine cleavage system H protein n=1 Tax=Paenibacillus hexagrammi TaxID=2908839 RepID=A0ABY3SMU9_9BACL|nr:glycine cleavage system protein GcvH [Paenibacillus sp. YPD9-1]UJF34411.1 glycine cleavage system protein GcvH [Paenibacillus sp. YPD9-1]